MNFNDFILLALLLLNIKMIIFIVKLLEIKQKDFDNEL